MIEEVQDAMICHVTLCLRKGALTLQDVDPSAGEALLEFRGWAVEQFGSVPSLA